MTTPLRVGQTVPDFASALSVGPGNEAGQVLDFVVGNDQAALFATPPAIAADGTLTYAPNPGQTGVANVSVQAHDDGGTANGGVDTSAIQTFVITVLPPLQPATVSAISDDDGDNLLPLNGSVQFDVDFSRAIDFSSIADTDFTISGSATASIDALAQLDADSVRVTVTATSGGSFQIALTGEVMDTFAIAVDAPFSDDDTFVVDAVAPVLSAITASPSGPSNAASVQFTVDFSEAVTGIDAADFVLVSDGSLTGTSIVDVVGSGASYTVSAATGSGDGQLVLGLSNTASAEDVAGNPLGLSAVQGTHVLDRIAPLPVSIGKLDTDLPTIPFVRFEVVFDEAVQGLDPTDFSLVMGGDIVDALVIDVSGSGTTWEVLVYTGLASGTLGLDLLDDDSITDLATNPLGQGLSGSASYLIDASQLIPVFKDGFEN